MANSTPDSTPEGKQRKSEWRIPRTISFSPEQDKHITEVVGEDGNASEYVRSLVDAASEGRIIMKPRQPNESLSVERARAYHRAKEAGMAFEDDVGRALDSVFKRDKTIHVVRSRVHNGDGVFVADFSVENNRGVVLVSIQCKSSPRPDRLELALAEAMIGSQKTKAPVITVIPYTLPECRVAEGQFAALKYDLVELSDLADKVQNVVAKRKAGA